MTENIEAAELRAQVTELERMVVAQTVTITELRAAAVAAQAPITNAIGDDDRLVLIGALGLLRGHRYKGCADALQRVLDADAAAPTPPADRRVHQETATSFDQYLAKKRYGSFTTRVLLKPCWDAAYQAGMDARPVADCYSDDDGDTWLDSPEDIAFLHGLQVGDEYELQASIRSWPERFRVTKAPDDTSDDYEVEPVSIRTAAQPDQAMAPQDWIDRMAHMMVDLCMDDDAAAEIMAHARKRVQPASGEDAKCE